MGGTIGRMRSHRPSKRGPDIRRKLAELQEPNAEKEVPEPSATASGIMQPMSKLFSNGAVGPNGYAKRRQIADLFTAKKNAASGKKDGYGDEEDKENSLPARRSKKFMFKTASGITVADESLLCDDEVSSHVRSREDGELEISSNRRDPVDEWRPTLYGDNRNDSSWGQKGEHDDFDKKHVVDRDLDHFAEKRDDRQRRMNGDNFNGHQEFDNCSDSGSTRGSRDYKQRDYWSRDHDEKHHGSRYGDDEDEKGYRQNSRHDDRDDYGHRRGHGGHGEFDAADESRYNSKAVASYKDRHSGDDEEEGDYFGEKERVVGSYRKPKSRRILGFRV